MKQVTQSPSDTLKAVTANDATDLPSGVTRGLYVGALGDVAITSGAGDEVTLVGLTPGVVHPFQVKRVKATGTTATNIIAVY